MDDVFSFVTRHQLFASVLLAQCFYSVALHRYSRSVSCLERALRPSRLKTWCALLRPREEIDRLTTLHREEEFALTVMSTKCEMLWPYVVLP